MKRFIIGLACLAFTAMSCVDALAGVWTANNGVGSISGSFDAFTPTTGDMTGPLTATNFHYNSSPSSRLAAFAGYTDPLMTEYTWGPNSTPNPVNFDAFGSTIGDPYTFTDTIFGTFTGTVVSDFEFNAVGPGSGNRTLDLVGLFTTGSNSHYAGGPAAVDATLQIAFSRNAGGAVNVAWSMNTSNVPEPASIAIFGLGALGVAGRRFRRK
jgi:hypothetical protein